MGTKKELANAERSRHRLRHLSVTTVAQSKPPQRSAHRFLEPLFAWYRHPTLNVWVLLVIGVLVAAHKPWALHTPQLWAEDGAIFLAFNDLHGVHAFIEPYMGYLLLIQRFVAWVAALLLDPRWWPAFYNWSAFAIICGVIARTFSPRLRLPGKPWLALAFLWGPHTGEILLTTTNVQWFTAVLLFELALVDAPRNRAEAIGDFATAAICGLTGPFAICFWPLLAWRLVRERTRHNMIVLLLTTACALVQGIFVLKTGPHFIFPAFQLGTMLTVFGQHTLAWAMVGSTWATRLPHFVLALIGIVPTVLLLVAALRPHPLRWVRGQIVLAFVIMVVATHYRARIDTWHPDNLVFSDRYFFIPRLLLYWLLVLEFDSAAVVGRWASRLAVAAIILVQLPDYRIPEPPDYHWAQYCDPIRRGVPANIPTLPAGWILEYRGRPGGK